MVSWLSFPKVSLGMMQPCCLHACGGVVSLLQALPFRASVAHHDAHHKYSSHPHNAKNYAESFWIWDAMFNTLRAPSKTV